MENAKAITMKNRKPATQGVCPVCGTKMFRIGRSTEQFGPRMKKARIAAESEHTTEYRLQALKKALNFPQGERIPISVKRAALAGYYGSKIQKIAEEAMRAPEPKRKRRTKYPEPEKLLYR